MALTPNAKVELQVDAPSLLYFDALPEAGGCALRPRLAPPPNAAPDARDIEVGAWRQPALSAGKWTVELRPDAACAGDALIRSELVPLADANLTGTIQPPDSRLIVCTGGRVPCQVRILGEKQSLLSVQLTRVYGDATPAPELLDGQKEAITARWSSASREAFLAWFDGFEGERTLRLPIDPWTSGAWWLHVENHQPPAEGATPVILIPYAVSEGSSTDEMNKALRSGLGVDIRSPPTAASEDEAFDKVILNLISDDGAR